MRLLCCVCSWFLTVSLPGHVEKLKTCCLKTHLTRLGYYEVEHKVSLQCSWGHWSNVGVGQGCLLLGRNSLYYPIVTVTGEVHHGTVLWLFLVQTCTNLPVHSLGCHAVFMFLHVCGGLQIYCSAELAQNTPRRRLGGFFCHQIAVGVLQGLGSCEQTLTCSVSHLRAAFRRARSCRFSFQKSLEEQVLGSVH